MIGSQERWQEDLFVAGPLRDLIPKDHVLRRVEKILDLSWLRQEVADAALVLAAVDPCYCCTERVIVTDDTTGDEKQIKGSDLVKLSHEKTRRIRKSLGV